MKLGIKESGPGLKTNLKKLAGTGPLKGLATD
jgi:hypothetical protein